MRYGTGCQHLPLLLGPHNDFVEEELEGGIALLHSTPHVLVCLDLAPQLSVAPAVLGRSLHCLVDLQESFARCDTAFALVIKSACLVVGSGTRTRPNQKLVFKSRVAYLN